MFTMKECSFPSYDLLRECKPDGWADKEEHIAKMCLFDRIWQSDLFVEFMVVLYQIHTKGAHCFLEG